MKRNKSNINFNFTPEQQEKFNIIYAETKKLYHHLVGDDVSKQRIKVLIAHSVISNDAPLNQK
jgi:tRNA(His) 5'-end guanylyltransferase